MNGEIGRAEGTRFFEQTSIASEGWSGASSDAAFFFGADTVHEGIAVLEEIRARVPTDFGRDRGVAWYAELGYKIVHNVTGATNNRIIKWGSTS
jgi:hypothetical protein